MTPTTEDGERPFKRARLHEALEEVVTLEVGDRDKTVRLFIHQKLLSAASPFFEAACKPEWMKPEDRVIKLPEDDPRAFKCFAYWIYHNKISVANDLPGSFTDDNTEKAMETTFGLFAKLFLIGEKYQIPRLKNDAVDATLDHSAEHWLPISAISHVYANTLPECVFRRVMVDIVHFTYDAEAIEEFADLMCREFLVDLAVSLCKNNNILATYEGVDLLTAREVCTEYHTHAKIPRVCSQLRIASIYDPKDL